MSDSVFNHLFPLYDGALHSSEVTEKRDALRKLFNAVMKVIDDTVVSIPERNDRLVLITKKFIVVVPDAPKGTSIQLYQRSQLVRANIAPAPWIDNWKGGSHHIQLYFADGSSAHINVETEFLGLPVVDLFKFLTQQF